MNNIIDSMKKNAILVFQDIYISLYKFSLAVLTVARKKSFINDTITVIKYDGIGDFILFLDFAKGLREYYCDKKIILACPLSVSDLAVQSGYFNQVYIINKQDLKIRNLWNTKKKLKQLQCELLISPGISRHLEADVIAKLIDANKKVSPAYSFMYPHKIANKLNNIFDVIYDTPLDIMGLEHNKLILHKLGYLNFRSSFPKLKTSNNTLIYIPNNYYVLFVGASSYDKQWSIKKFYNVAKYIEENTNFQCVIAGTTKEVNQERYLSEKGLKYYTYIGKTTFNELIYLISNAKFVVGNDTSAIHIAAALNVPSLCTSGAEASERFYPYVVDNMETGKAPLYVKKDVECEACSFKYESYARCLKFSNKKPCIEQIEEKEVIKELKSLLATL